MNLHNLPCFMVLLVAFTTSGLHAQFMDLHLERVAHYPFSVQATDISGLDNHGEVYGAIPGPGYDGETEGAYQFDGADDHIYCGNGLPAITETITVTCWIRTETSVASSHIVSKYDFLSDGGFILGTENGYAKWAGRIGTGQFFRMTSASKINDGQWHFLAGVVEGSMWLLYVDGILQNQLDTGSESTDLSNQAPLVVGAHLQGEEGSEQHFNGLIDNIIIYRRLLNECEMEFLFTGEPNGAR